MEAVAEKLREQGKGGETSLGVCAPALPTLWPHMLLGRPRRTAAPFPFDDPGVHYTYFARNGIYALARLWGLAGREVLFPAYFHGVELEALLEAGVRPRFYPVHDKMRVDPDEVLARRTKDTAAVYLIHYLGFPGPVAPIAAACREQGIPLIEDCALALLSGTPEGPLGMSGDAAVFCLYKTLPTPNGGAIVLRRDGVRLPRGEAPPRLSTVAHAAASLLGNLELRAGAAGRVLRRGARAIGRVAVRASSAQRIPTGTQHFDRSHAVLAMSRLSHVVLEAQDFAEIVERRRRNYFHLAGRLRGAAAPIFTELPPGVCPLFYPLVTGEKQQVLRKLWARGIEAVDFWRIAHPALARGAFPEVDHLRASVIELPCHQDLSPRTIDRIAQLTIDALREVA